MAWPFLNNSKPNQIDENISKLERLRAAKKTSETEPRDSHTAGPTSTKLKVVYPGNYGKLNMHTHTHTHPFPTHTHAQELEVNSELERDMQNVLSSERRPAAASATHNAGL